MAQVPLVTDPSIEFADPFDNAEHTQAEVASQWKLMWWKFKRHKMAVVGGIVVLMFYLVALFAEFVAPIHFTSYNETYVYAPPQEIHLLQNGRFSPTFLATALNAIQPPSRKPGSSTKASSSRLVSL
ncbi:MAG: hypothetical protein R3E31_01490 [Chloroflexota bacterium]